MLLVATSDQPAMMRNKCPMTATAIAEYFKTGKAAKLRVMSEMFDEDEIPVKTLFRTYAQMSKLDKLALEKAQGTYKRESAFFARPA